MLTDTTLLLEQARRHCFAVAACNIYTLEGAVAVVQAAEELDSPIILQLLPKALDIGGSALIAMCLELAGSSRIPVAVHLDHCSCRDQIQFAIKAGLTSIMADGSSLDLAGNIAFTREMVALVKSTGGRVEGELGRLSGEEDGLSVAEKEAKMTDPGEAAAFVEETGVAALAVCIGNIHGRYLQPPALDFSRLAAIAEAVSVPLVLHGASGLPEPMISTAIAHGVCKCNLNTEIRSACVSALAHGLAISSKVELVHLMHLSITAMKKVVAEKIGLFRSTNKAKLFINN